MGEYVISSCSPADLSKDWMEKRNIAYIEYHYELGGTQYKDDFGESVAPHELYRRMLAGEDSKTSQVSVGERLWYDGKLYKVVQAHTIQND